MSSDSLYKNKILVSTSGKGEGVQVIYTKEILLLPACLIVVDTQKSLSPTTLVAHFKIQIFC